MFKKIAFIALAIVLILVNWSIFNKEKQLAEGKIVYLELAPVDPRSLMQGDYMALRFRLTDEVYKALLKAENGRPPAQDKGSSDGSVVISMDARNIGSFKRLHTDQPLAQNEVLMRYRVRNGTIKFATNAYYFQEGHGKYYQPARYGQFRVDEKGELLLVAMYDKDLVKLEPNEKNDR
ncbi:GDYXXLXY domain-containing protein [Desulforhopalus sp. 52FAK]